MSTDQRPNVLIFGGLNVVVEALIDHLIPPLPAQPLISHVRITDKFSINPPTTYVSNTLRRVLEERKDLVEYRQGNVTNPDVVSDSYTTPSPNGRLYTYIIDLTGDIDYAHPAGVHIAHTFTPALIIARASASQLARFPGSIKAHVRVIPPFYEHVDSKKRYKEGDQKGWGFDVGKGAVRALWWHEATRAVGSVQGLPLVMLKFGIPYGKGLVGIELTSIILLGLVYKHANETMKLLWSPKLPKNTINLADFAGLIWAAADWISTKTREEANAIAGVPILPSVDPSPSLTLTSTCPDLVPSTSGPIIIPVFNIADEGDSTQRSISEVVGEVFGIKVGFYTGIKGLLARWKMKDMLENINEMHMENWNAVITSCTPPVPETPLSPYIPLYQLEEHGCALDCEKMRKILQYKFRYPTFDKKAVEDFIEWCRQEGIWPETGTPAVASSSAAISADAPVPESVPPAEPAPGLLSANGSVDVPGTAPKVEAEAGAGEPISDPPLAPTADTDTDTDQDQDRDQVPELKLVSEAASEAISAPAPAPVVTQEPVVDGAVEPPAAVPAPALKQDPAAVGAITTPGPGPGPLPTSSTTPDDTLTPEVVGASTSTAAA